MAEDRARATPVKPEQDTVPPGAGLHTGRSSEVPSPRSVDEAQAEATTQARSWLSYVPVRQLVLFAIAIVGLYFVWPQLVSLFSQVPQLRGISWLWFVLMGLLESASFVCMWGLMRLTLNEDSWFLVGTSQLISNAVSRVIPGGVASGGTASYQLLTVEGAPPERIVSGLTANTLLSTGMLFALPALALPAVLFGGVTIARSLLHALTYGIIVFALILVAGAVSLFTDKPLRGVGVVLQRVRNRLRRKHPPMTDLPDRLIAERDLIRSMLGRRWWAALPFAAGNWLLDYGALLAALAAVGVRPRASLVLVAYVVAALLGMIPITPGGLGFVEVGLAATLTLAGVGAADATLATLAYRLVAFWMPIPAGGVAYVLYRRRYGVNGAARAPAHRRSR